MPTYHVAVDVEDPRGPGVTTHNCVVTVPAGKDAAERVALRQIGRHFPERRISVRHCKLMRARGRSWAPLIP